MNWTTKLSCVAIVCILLHLKMNVTAKTLKRARSRQIENVGVVDRYIKDKTIEGSPDGYKTSVNWLWTKPTAIFLLEVLEM